MIFGLSPGELHHGALGIARSGGRLGIPVHRLACERSSPVTLSRYNSSWTQIPHDAGAEQVLDIMHGVVKRIGTPILIPVDDAGSVFVYEHAHELEDFLFPHQSEGLARRLSSKRGMYTLCQELEIPTPLSAFPRSERDAVELASHMTFPTVLKCINAGDAPLCSPRVTIVPDAEHLLDAYRSMEASDVPNVMLQEYIPGTPETVWMFNGYFDAGSVCKVGFTGKKIRQ